MSEQEKSELTSRSVGDEHVGEGQAGEASAPRNSRRAIFIGLSILAVVVIGGILFWKLRSREGGRPVSAPTDVTFGEDRVSPASSSEQMLTIPADQVEKIGLKSESAGETLSSEAMTASATGVIQPNAYRETPVMSLVGGVLRSVNVQLGDSVGSGQNVAVISSSDLSAAESAYLTTLAEAGEADKRYERALKLADIAEESRTELDQAITAVRIAEAEHFEHVNHFERTTKLLKIGAASGEEYEMIRSQHETAAAKLDEANSRLDRAKKLLAINPQRHAELDAALTQKRSAEAKSEAERQNLLILGISPQQAARLKLTRRIDSALPVRSPVAGTVTTRTVNAGEIIEANKELMRITDLSTVWAIAQVYEKDIGGLRVGGGASVTTDMYPGKLFRGHIAYIDPNIDQATRTAQVRIELDNPGHILKLGTYVNVAFGATGNAERTVPTIPVAAVQNLNERQVVFVLTDKPNIFIVKQIRLGKQDNGRYPVLEGLQVGDKVVTEGSFLLRAELQKQAH